MTSHEIPGMIFPEREEGQKIINMRRRVENLGYWPIAFEGPAVSTWMGPFFGLELQYAETDAMICRPKDFDPRARLKIQPPVRIYP